MSDALIIETQGNTALITMNNPSANTWTLESLSALNDIVA